MSIPSIVTQHLVAAGLCLVGLTAAGGKHGAAAPAPAALDLDLDGLGPVKVGMSVGEAERALGFALAADRAPDPECYYVENRARLPGAALMVVGDRVVRTDVYDPGPRTTAGVEVGSREDEVLLAYPAAVVRPSPYAERGHAIWVEDGARALVFETDGATVAGFRGGERDAVGAIEGCE